MSSLRAELESFRQERDKLRDQLNDMAGRAGEWYDSAKEAQRQHDELKAIQSQSQQIPDLDVVRDRVLSNLNRKVGKQSPEYKRTKTVLDSFIEEVKQTARQTPSDCDILDQYPTMSVKKWHTQNCNDYKLSEQKF